MTTYTLPAFVIAADTGSVPTDAFTSEMVFVAPDSAPSFSYSVILVEDFDGLGAASLVSLDQTIYLKTVDNGAIIVPETNYHVIFEVLWGAGNRSILMVASADASTRVGIVLDGDPFPAITSLTDYYDWVDTFTSLSAVTSGPFGPGEQISYADFPGVQLSESETTTGTPGDDFLVGGPDDDAFDGLAGTDTVIFEGAQDNYTLEISQSGFVIEDRRADGQGRDTLTNIEFIDFDPEIALLEGKPLELDAYDGALDISTEDFLQIIELYIAYFNRAPDAVGLLFWANAFAEGTTLPEMAALFIDQDETRALYPTDLSNSDIATAVYDNVLGRVPDPDGFDFWVEKLDSGDVSRDQFILAVLEGAKADPPSGASQDFIDQQLADRAYLLNKIDIGTYFAITKGMSDVENAAAAMALFDGSQVGLDDAVAAIDGNYLEALVPNSGEFLMPLIGVLDDPFV